MISTGAPNNRITLRSYLAADAVFNNTTTLSATDLSVTVLAGTGYDVEVYLHIDSAAQDILLDFGGTATLTSFIGQYEQLDTIDGKVYTGARVTSAGTDFTGANAGDPSFIRFTGCALFNAGGTFLIRGAQAIADASNTSILTGSALLLTKI